MADKVPRYKEDLQKLFAGSGTGDVSGLLESAGKGSILKGNAAIKGKLKEAFKIAGIPAPEFVTIFFMGDMIAVRYVFVVIIIVIIIYILYYLGSMRLPSIGSPEIVGTQFYEDHVLDELSYSITAIELLGDKITSDTNAVFLNEIFQQSDKREGFIQDINFIDTIINGPHGIRKLSEKAEKINKENEE